MAKLEKITSLFGGLSGKAMKAKQERKKRLEEMAEKTKTSVAPKKKRKK